MRQLKLVILFTCCSILLAMLVPSLPAWAVESFGVGAIPAHPRPDNPRTKSIFVYEIEPGNTQTDAVRVINNTDQTRTIKVYAVDSEHSSDGAFACAQAVEQKKDVGAWLNLGTDQVTLAPGSNQDIAFEVRVPTTAETGEHNGCIAIEDIAAPTQNTGNGIVIHFRSALRVAVTIPGDTHASLTFTRFTTEERQQALNVSPVLQNTGNVSVDASVKVKLLTAFGTSLAAAEGTFVVLNKNESRFNFELPRPFWGGWYWLESSVNYAPLQQSSAKQHEKTHVSAPSRWLFVTPQPLAWLVYAFVLAVAVFGCIFLICRRRRWKRLHQATTTHVVKNGDSLQSLAAAAGVSWRSIAKMNRLKPPYSLTVGQRVQLPKLHTKTLRNVKKQS